MMRCPLCGHRFDAAHAGRACQGCPAAGACHMVRCPNCGYEVPRESRLVSAFRALRRRYGAERAG
jgi:predicted amidophosphoribosyltransferase